MIAGIRVMVGALGLMLHACAADRSRRRSTRCPGAERFLPRDTGLEGPYREQLYAVCVRGRRGGQAIAAQGWAPLAHEADLGPIIVEACKTFEILP